MEKNDFFIIILFKNEEIYKKTAIFIKSYRFFRHFYKAANTFKPYLCSTKNENSSSRSKIRNYAKKKKLEICGATKLEPLPHFTITANSSDFLFFPQGLNADGNRIFTLLNNT